ncbi:hypothetical protein [Pectobacterium aroidearum]|uniref:hypothetical protein n=1 Tax=Pectobacterium aroidearum TaxID=1201031 RepID=UPI0030182DD8
MANYLRLRLPQWLLIISIALPVTVLFSVHVSAVGFIDTGTFWMVLTGSIVVMWGGLALYTREIDRQCGLPDGLMTFVKYENTTASMKQNQKAEIIRMILQDDSLYRKQIRQWGKGLCLMAGKAFIWLPAVLLTAICLMFWFFPGDVVRQIRDWRDADLACVVYTAANLFFTLFVVTGGLAGMMHMYGKKEEELVCFRAAYQERVCQWISGQQQTEDETPAMNDDGPK